MLTVAVLMTVHSRKTATLTCLDRFFQQADTLRGEGKYEFPVFMVDDGSTDGTAEAVRERYPQVEIIKGDGTLFWNQGMRRAWDEAESRLKPDFFLWVNDDTTLLEGKLAVLMETSEFFRHKAIVVGTCTDKNDNLSYGGRTRSGKIIAPDEAIPLPCYTFNGNLVLVPRSVYRILGNLDQVYRHTFGDYDYGVRAYRKDVPRVVAPGVLANCNRNPGVEKWRDASVPLRDRLRYLESPKGRPFKEQFRFDLRDKGIFWAIGHGVSVFFKMLFPVRRGTAAGVV